MEDKEMGYQTYQYVIIERKGHIGILTTNRPDKVNAFNHQTAMDFRNALLELDEDKEVWAIIIRAAGDDFGSGEDIFALKEDASREEGDKLANHFHRVFDTLDATYKPITAAFQGRAIGGCYCILYYCDTIVASEDARFQVGTINLGSSNVWRMKRMERCVGTKKAFEWIMSGDWITAAEAEKYGFVNKVVPREKLDEAAMEMAERFASKSPLAMQVSKKGWLQARDMSIKDSELFLLTVREHRLQSSEDYKEGLAARREKRAPVWKGR